MMTPPDDFDPPVGIAADLAPGLRRLVAPNPSPMTYRGTNTYRNVLIEIKTAAKS